MRDQHGFTLIELMIVIAIIAILSAIAITAYTTSIGKAQFSEALTIGDGLKTDVAIYFRETGQCPTNGTNGIEPTGSYTGKYVTSATVSNVAGGCRITAQLRSNTIAPRLRGKQVVLTMSSQGGTTAWTCATDAPSQYVPQTCR